MFERACTRTGIPIAYTCGFNPHPLISLPLPRPVGIESNDDIFCVWIKMPADSFERQKFEDGFSAQMPAGISINAVNISNSGKSPSPQAAEYYLPLKKDLLDDNTRINTLKSAVKSLLSAQNVMILRDERARNRRIKNLDVRPFIDDIIIDNKGITIRCIISSGSIRVDEIQTLLGLSIDDSAGAVKRLSVQWNEETL